MRSSLILGFLVLGLSTTWAAESGLDAGGVQDRLVRLNRIEAAVQHGQLTDERLGALIQEASADQADAQDCLGVQQTRADSIAQQLLASGAATPGESTQATKARADLQLQQTQASALLSDCRLLSVTSGNRLQALQTLQRQQLSHSLSQRGPTTFRLLANWIDHPPDVGALFDQQELANWVGFEPTDLAWMGTLAFAGWVLGWLAHRSLRQRPATSESEVRLLARASRRLSSQFPGLLIGALCSLYWLIRGASSTGWPILASLAFAILGYQCLLAVVRVAVDQPVVTRDRQAWEDDPPEAGAERISGVLRALALISTVGVVLFLSPLTESMRPDTLLLLRSIWGATVAVNLLWALWQSPPWGGISRFGIVQLSTTVALLGALGAEWLGFRHLSVFVGRGVFLTLLCLLLARLAARSGDSFIQRLNTGGRAWQLGLRSRLGIEPGELIPGLFWLRLLVRLCVGFGLALALMDVWGLPDSAQVMLLHWVGQGVDLGPLRIEPVRVLVAILALGALLSLVSWARRPLERRLASAHLEASARDTVVAMTSYSLMIASGLAALSIAGVQLQNLAIVAGALSVGIGFGMQNIVNNFVSGLILLFERPIRPGDWVMVNAIEGTVRRISIRSTQIQTFDRAEVIVPNSELISNSVTNWMLRDPFGRLRVPVGVAYGSNLQRVKQTLLRVAAEHPHVVRGHPLVPDPSVLFLSFGDSALDFELRVFVHDIGKRLTVLSDLNFAIDAAFREAGIGIPFPQRDLHVFSDTAPGSVGVMERPVSATRSNGGVMAAPEECAGRGRIS